MKQKNFYRKFENVLVTGGAGFIGSNFIRFLTKTEPDIQIVTLDLLTYAGHLESLADIMGDHYHFIRGDICDSKLVRKILIDYKIDTVVHFAAESHVDRSIQDPGAFVQTNIVGTYTLLENCRQAWNENGGFGGNHFHHVSTDEVFGMLSKDDPPFSETTPYAPNSPYAASKASSDHLVRSYFRTFGFPITITNCSNNYGPFQFPEKLIPLIILNAINGKDLPIYGDGQQIRDWLYVEDHCEAIHTVIKAGETGETYNIGGENQFPNLKIVQKICSILDKALIDSPYTPHENLIRFVPDRPGHDLRYDIDITKIRSRLGWEPSNDLAKGLEKTIQWYLQNREWIESVTGTPAFQKWLTTNYDKR